MLAALWCRQPPPLPSDQHLPKRGRRLLRWAAGRRIAASSGDGSNCSRQLCCAACWCTVPVRGPASRRYANTRDRLPDRTVSPYLSGGSGAGRLGPPTQAPPCAAPPFCRRGALCTCSVFPNPCLADADPRQQRVPARRSFADCASVPFPPVAFCQVPWRRVSLPWACKSLALRSKGTGSHSWHVRCAPLHEHHRCPPAIPIDCGR